ATLPDEYRRRRFALSVAGYFGDPRLAMALTPFRMQARTADAIRASLGAHDFRDEVAGLDGSRVLVIHGDRDPIDCSLLRDVADRTASQLELMSGSGLVPYLEASDSFFSILRRFLGEST